jgi:uncharacterized membrane protein
LPSAQGGGLMPAQFRREALAPAASNERPLGQSTTSRLAAWWPGLVLALLIAGYVAYFGTLTVQKHNAFLSTAFDLGNVDQAVWNTRHGRPFALTNIQGLENRLGTHVEPILLPVSLLYFLWSDPRALLLLQTLVIGLGAWPVYLLARRQWADGEAGKRLPGHLAALVFALAYLLFPALQSANYFDFHAVALAPTFFLFALYFLETERWGAFALFSLLTMSCKEDAPLLVLMLGFYALLVRRRPWIGLATMACSLAWFGLAVGWIMPHFDTRGVSPLANRYAYLGDGPAEMAMTMLTRPGLVLERLVTGQSLAYLRDLLAPTAFLSLLAPQVLMLALPSLAVNLLSTDGFMHQLEGFHYGAPLAPIAVASAAYGAGWLVRRARQVRPLLPVLTLLVLAASLLYHRGHGYTPLAAGWRDLWPQVTAHHRLGAQMAAELPAAAAVAALPRLNPHASQRERLLVILEEMDHGLLAPLQEAGGTWSADLAWLDVTNAWPLHPNDLRLGVQNMLAGEWGVERGADGWLLLRRGGGGRELPEAFFDYARAPGARPEYPLLLQFYLPGDEPSAGAEPILECLGFDLVSDERQGTRGLAIYWRALRPLPPGLRLYPYFFDDDSGQIVEDTSLRPMIETTWYPPEAWQPGETVVTRMLPWDVGDDVAIGMGATMGADWSAVEERLRLRVESSRAVVRLFDGDTWARLLGLRAGRPVDEPRAFALPSPGQPLQADFGGWVRLLGVDLQQDLAAAPGALRLTFHWQALARMETSYAVFAQILGPAGAVRAQADEVPRGGGYPTTWWLPGEVVSHEVTLALPPGFEAGGFRLIAGLYDPVTGTRLPVDGTGSDFVELELAAP